MPLCDPNCVSRSQQCQTVLTENFLFFSDKVETLYDFSLPQVDHECTTIFYFHTCSWEIIDIFSRMKKLDRWVFLGHC